MKENILVTRSSMPELREYVDEIKELWDTHWLTNMGVKHKELQEQLKQFLRVSYIDLFTNGHMALELCIQAMGFSRGDEVITTPYTFASTTHAIVRNGLKPVFADIDKENFTLDASKIESLITNRTKAIIPVHVYGNVCNVSEIDDIAKKYHLKVIYDAAHAFGVKYKEKGIGTFGDASCFSFHATKVFNTIEGGAVTFSNSELAEILYGLKNFGIKNEEVVSQVGANAKMNEFCAAMGICNLRHFKEAVRARKTIVMHYRNRLKNIDGLQLNTIQKDAETNYAYFPVVFHEKDFGSNRDYVWKKLTDNQIYARKYFYPITSVFQCYGTQFNPDWTPNAYNISERVLTLPLYEGLAIDEINKICDIILECRGLGKCNM